MRLWSIHPGYLDAKGIVALWREALLAQAVLRGQTVGYRKHPQLLRFQKHPQSLAAINTYLLHVLEEAGRRGYRFDETKVDKQNHTDVCIDVTNGQLQYEHSFLCKKLQKRDPGTLNRIKNEANIRVHPLFQRVDGDVESWEKVK